jgi:hypothetical protein
MKNFLWRIMLVVGLFSLNMANVFWITLQVPTPSGQEDIVVTWPTQIESDETTIFDIIQIVNDYLWFSVAGVAMIVLVYGWIKLITGQWNKEVVSSANKMIVSSMIAIFVSIISYALIKLVVNLF